MIIAFLTIIAGAICATETPQYPGKALPSNSNLVGSVSLTNGIFHARELIEIHATYSNRSEVAVNIDEGSLMVQFHNPEQERMFMQAIRASYKRGVKTITLKPGEEYKDTLALVPKANVKPGMFKAKIVSYIRRHELTQTLDMGVVVFEIR
jgi:uncharacterized membrane protein